MAKKKSKKTTAKKGAAPADKSMEAWIWDAACSIRGAAEASKYKEYILPLIFVKRLCDVFDDELNRIAARVKTRDKAFKLVKADKELVRFYRTLLDFECPNAEDVGREIGRTFVEYPLWEEYDDDLRKLRREVTFAIHAEADDENTVAGWVDEIFRLLRKLNTEGSE